MAAKKKSDAKKSDLISSASVFFSDIDLPHMNYAVLIRSPISGGTIRSITLPSIPDSYHLITAKDIPGDNTVSVFEQQVHVLAGERVSYKGEPIALLCGPDEKTLHFLSEKVEILFTEHFTEEKNDESVNEQQILSRRIVRYGESDSAFIKSHIKIENEYTAHVQYALLNEPIGAAAQFASDGRLILYTPTQWPHHVRRTVCSVLSIDSSSIDIQKTISNDSSTNKIWYNSILCALAALAANISGRPVKLVLTRKEQKKYIDRSTKVIYKFRTGIDNSGKITALNISILFDAGAYSPFAPDVLDRLVLAAAGIYKPDTMCIEGFAVKSRTPPMSADIQLADSCSFYAIENHIQQIAHTAHIDPVEIRQKNMINPQISDMPFPFTFQTDGMNEVLQTTAVKSDFFRKYTSYFLNASARDVFESSMPVRGIGIASAFEGSGFYGSTINSANLSIEVTMEIDSSVVIHAYTPSRSIQSIWKKLASVVLGINLEAVSVRSEFSFTDEPLLPQTITDNISIMTQLLKKACTALQKLRFRQGLPITIKRSVSPSRKKIWNAKQFCGTPFHSMSLGAAVIELEIDSWTYTDKIKNIWIAIDAGEILDKKQAEMTVKKAVQHVLSNIRDKGFSDLPRINLTFLQSSGEPKQIGEIIYNIIPAAYINALSTALHKTLPSIPVSSESLYNALYMGKADTDENEKDDEIDDNKEDRTPVNETDTDN